MQNCYDAIIIGAGMSGLGAGIRLAHFEKKVCILEKHSLWGGLNSFYKKGGRPFDVGLHAMTNYASKEKRGPLSMICRQLRLDRERLKLNEQLESEVRFPGFALRFSNELALLESEIEKTFPKQIDGFKTLCQKVTEYNDGTLKPAFLSAREQIAQWVSEPILREMILCPLMFYGSARENDMDWHQFVIMFKSIFLEGFCRPEGGVRTLLDILRKEYKEKGGELRLNTEVERIEKSASGNVQVILKDGKVLEAKKVFSSAGNVETQMLIGENAHAEHAGQMTFVESIFCLNKPAKELGFDKTIVFFSQNPLFQYKKSQKLVDLSSGIICVPDNFKGTKISSEGMVRVTHIANYDLWKEKKVAGETEYLSAKNEFIEAQLDALTAFGKPLKDSIVYQDSFTPLTIEKFTSHVNGAVYGCEEKNFTGETAIPHVYLMGTDQGYLGIIGALLSGVIMANRYGLGEG